MAIITRLWSKQPGKYFCISSKNSRGVWRDNFFSKDQVIAGAADAFVKEHHECDLYFCPTGFKERRRSADGVMFPKMLWADLDEANPWDIKKSLRPTIAIESSPGRFVGLWIIDKVHNNDINRALTYFVGADKGGWDATQVLRIPGTLNYKYSSMPRVRIAWADGDEHRLEDIAKSIKYVKGSSRSGSGSRGGGATGADMSAVANGAGLGGSVAATYRRWEKKLPQWARRGLMGGKVDVVKGKRSEMFWKLANTLTERGLPYEDKYVLLRASPWNKFIGRDEQLHRELAKIMDIKLGAGSGGGGGGEMNGHWRSEEDDEKDEGYQWLSKPMDQVEEENIDWIWYPYLARGELSILEGDPGLGKSYMAQMVAGSLCDGRTLPNVTETGIDVGKWGGVQGKVVYFDIENSAGSVTLKRLRGNGFKRLGNYIQEEQVFSIDDEERLEEIHEALERVRPVLVVFDTINTYLGKADAFKGHEAQQAFVKFREIAKRFNCAVLVLRHLTKGTKERALYRGQGSIAFAGLARVVMTVGVMPSDEETRVMAVTKLNVTVKPPALTFTIEGRPDQGGERDRSRFKWGEYVEISSEDILQPSDGEGKKNNAHAQTMLKEWLSGGEIELHKVENFGESHGISKPQLRRAARELGIVRDHNKENGNWYWSLPPGGDVGEKHKIRLKKVVVKKIT